MQEETSTNLCGFKTVSKEKLPNDALGTLILKGFFILFVQHIKLSRIKREIV